MELFTRKSNVVCRIGFKKGSLAFLKGKNRSVLGIDFSRIFAVKARKAFKEGGFSASAWAGKSCKGSFSKRKRQVLENFASRIGKA